MFMLASTIAIARRYPKNAWQICVYPRLSIRSAFPLVAALENCTGDKLQSRKYLLRPSRDERRRCSEKPSKSTAGALVTAASAGVWTTSSRSVFTSDAATLSVDLFFVADAEYMTRAMNKIYFRLSRIGRIHHRSITDAAVASGTVAPPN